MSTDLDLGALKELCEKVTPGPWEAERREPFMDGRSHYAFRRRDVPGVFATMSTLGPDADFIAASRSAVPALIAEVERLRAETISSDDGRCTDTATGCAGTRCQNHRSDGYTTCFICRDRRDLAREVVRLSSEVERLRRVIAKVTSRVARWETRGKGLHEKFKYGDELHIVGTAYLDRVGELRRILAAVDKEDHQ